MIPNILITGANGQLGSEIKKISNFFLNFNYFYTDVENLDITDFDVLKTYCKKNKISLIINCAAYTAVDKAEEEKEKAYLINSKSVENLLNVSKLLQIFLIHVSTDYVFDGKNYIPYKEDDNTSPQSVYGLSKLSGENFLKDYEKSIIIRTSWLYSIFGNNFVKTIIKISNQNEQIKVVFDQIGTPTNAEDLAYACLKIAAKTLQKQKAEYGIYHFSNEGVCSWYDFAKFIVDFKKIKCKVLPVKSNEFPRPAPRPFYSVLDKTKIKQTFEIEISHWTESLVNCLNQIQ